jgi:hypothetical protein
LLPHRQTSLFLFDLSSVCERRRRRRVIKRLPEALRRSVESYLLAVVLTWIR